MNELAQTASQLMAPSKGLLAADESTGTITKRFEAVGLTSTPELNRKYRQMLLTTPEIENYLSGVIMFDETVRQKLDSGETFPEYLTKRRIIPGIKVDEGKDPAPNSANESVTKGLDGLDGRLKEYKDMGLKFTKWRAEIKIADGLPTAEVILENARRLAQYAKISQEQGFVPVVEPEVVRDGGHDLAKCEEVIRQVLTVTFSELERKSVDLAGMLLKTSMVTAGKESATKSTAAEVAAATLRVLSKVSPDELTGVVFLSGGQSPDEATENLNAINVSASGKYPWQLSFSFARALQGEALEAWKGQDANVKMAQEAFIARARMVSQARSGKYAK
ncbi:fructose-bisphosphate aldolase class I [Candidatus Woesebacteria bacterium]|nr:fructose-bisphosphate aldolase class I [Candidatus Woesebacteria bacterium]